MTTITIDGDMSDWSAVLADPLQTSDDGPAQGLPDRDAPVQSTGRDLSTFSWTYDANYFYMYIERVGSAKNRQRYWFYLDVNFDGLMQTGEPVFHVSWWGNKRDTESWLYLYSAVSPGGDSLGDAAGFADGWTMPGMIGSAVLLETAKGGSFSGLEMESRVSWAQLGVPSGTPFQFHVSSSNTDNLPGQIDDNMGGPGGKVGTTQLPGVLLEPDVATTAVPAGNAVMGHTVTNTGNAPDTFNLTWSAVGDFSPSSVVFYEDLDGDGRLDAGEPLLGDTDGDLERDTGVIVDGGSIDILAVAAVPAGVVDGEVSTVSLVAASSVAAAIADGATDTITVARPDITLVKSVDRANADPGDLLTYTVSYTSDGTADAHNAIIVDAIPVFTVYQTGSAVGAGSTIEFSHDGGGTFDGSDAAPVTHIRWTLGTPLAPGAVGSVRFQVAVQ
jgi:uncharacterized repeat protein (TIGR01451 family)